MTMEIKFRAWDGEKMFFYPKWSTLHSKFVLYFSEQIDYVDDSDNDNSVVLMQYTGLKDKNGVEIYEGDILKYSDAEIAHYIIKWSNEAARWHDTRIEDGDSQTDYDGFDFVKDCVVVGNIYQNPELLNP